MGYHIPQRSACQVASGQDPVVKVEGPPYSLVNMRLWNLEKKVQQAGRSDSHLDQAHTPVEFVLLFFFSLFSISILLLLLLF